MHCTCDAISQDELNTCVRAKCYRHSVMLMFLLHVRRHEKRIISDFVGRTLVDRTKQLHHKMSVVWCHFHHKISIHTHTHLIRFVCAQFFTRYVTEIVRATYIKYIFSSVVFFHTIIHTQKYRNCQNPFH